MEKISWEFFLLLSSKLDPYKREEKNIVGKNRLQIFSQVEYKKKKKERKRNHHELHYHLHVINEIQT